LGEIAQECRFGLEDVGLGDGSARQVQQAALRTQVQAASFSTGPVTDV